jgi:hypothetical protein
LVVVAIIDLPVVDVKVQIDVSIGFSKFGEDFRIPIPGTNHWFDNPKDAFWRAIRSQVTPQRA